MRKKLLAALLSATAFGCADDFNLQRADQIADPLTPKADGGITTLGVATHPYFYYYKGQSSDYEYVSWSDDGITWAGDIKVIGPSSGRGYPILSTPLSPAATVLPSGQI